MFCFLLIDLARAQTRVATVNLDQLFNQYWKTGLMRAALKKKAVQFDRTDRQMTADLRKARDKYRKLLGESDNEALSPVEHVKYQREAAAQLTRARELDYNLATFEQQAHANLAEYESRARKDLLVDISSAITNVARAKGYTLVMDANTPDSDAGSGEPDLPPTVLYAGVANDLTQSVLSELNAGAPVNPMVTGSSAPESNEDE